MRPGSSTMYGAMTPCHWDRLSPEFPAGPAKPESKDLTSEVSSKLCSSDGVYAC